MKALFAFSYSPATEGDGARYRLLVAGTSYVLQQLAPNLIGEMSWHNANEDWLVAFVLLRISSLMASKEFAPSGVVGDHFEVELGTIRRPTVNPD